MDSTGSFVLVDPPPLDQLALLDPYLPSLSKPSQFEWNPDLVHHLTERRQAVPDHRLFFDELVQLAGLQGPSVYPPESPNDLQSLVSHILSAPGLSSLNQASLLYYLVLTASPEAAAAFALARLLPPEFSLSVRAFHAFDHGEYDLAVRLLADPRVRQPDFVPKTIRLLASAAVPPRDRSRLVVAYSRLTRLSLGKDAAAPIDVRDAEVVLRAWCDSARTRGVLEAWDLAKRRGDEGETEHLMRSILATCFGDNHARTPVAQHLRSLLAYPFSAAEISLLSSFALSPPSTIPSPSLVANWYLSLLISRNQPIEALVFHERSKAQQAGPQRLERDDERERLIKVVESTLTKSQRTALEIELAALSTAAPNTSTAPAVQPPAPTTSTSTITQPAWAPAAPIPIGAPSTTPDPAPPRTLAAARLAALPPPPSPAPKPTDLPLSASPFVRTEAQTAPSSLSTSRGTLPNGTGSNDATSTNNMTSRSSRSGPGGILRALKEQQQQGDRRASLGTLGAPASPARSFVVPALGAERALSMSNGGQGGGGGGSSVASFKTGTGSTVPPSTVGVGFDGIGFTSTGGMTRLDGAQQGWPQHATSTPSPTKPTLAGFGSVRSVPSAQFNPLGSTPRASTSVRRVDPAEAEMEVDDASNEARQVGQGEDDDDMSYSSPPPVEDLRASTARRIEGPDGSSDFSRRVALDPAIQATLRAASNPKSSTRARPPPAETPRRAMDTVKPTPKRTRSSKTTEREAANGGRDRHEDEGSAEEDDAVQDRSASRRTTKENDRGDKRRAVSSEPPARDEVGARRTPDGEVRDKPDADKTIRLPPGAFPDDDDVDGDARPSRRSTSRAPLSHENDDGQGQVEMRQVSRAGAGRRSTRSTRSASKANANDEGTAPTPRRRTTVDPEDDSAPSTRRRSTRASSTQPVPEMTQVKSPQATRSASRADSTANPKTPKPVRRSSRLSTSSTAHEDSGPAHGTARRSTRRAQRAIEEEDEEFDEAD
ncbi:hypothetical protein JCM10212_006674 [Sporobolomyces blumeae]